VSKIVGPAIALAGALEKLAVPKTANALAKTFGDVKDVAENGRLAETFNVMKDFGVAMEPLMAPLSMITSQINAGTIENVIKLSTSMFNLMENPAIQTIFDYMIRFFNNILEGVDRFVTFVDKFSDFSANLAETNPTFAKVIGYLDKIILYVIDFATYGERAQIFFKVVGDFLKDKLEPLMEPTKDFLIQVGTFISNVFSGFMHWIKDDVIPWLEPRLTNLQMILQDSFAFWSEKLGPAFETFVGWLSQIETAFQNLTGIDVGAWIRSLIDAIKGWFD
jgi:hypothetical protein